MTTDLYRQLHRQRNHIAVKNITESKAIWLEFRQKNGFKAYANLLTEPGSNVKLNKSKDDALIYGLSLAPASASGEYQVCRYRTQTCEANCVAYSNKGTLDTVQKARAVRTQFLGEYPSEFMTILFREIVDIQNKYGKDKKIAFRLNTFSDIPWETVAPWLFELLPDVQFYDYTKWPVRQTPANYHITYSASENTKDEEIPYIMKWGARNVAVVFSPSRTKDLPATWNGMKVIDGDKTDARFKDPKNVVVGLRAKGRMRKNPGGMVRVV